MPEPDILLGFQTVQKWLRAGGPTPPGQIVDHQEPRLQALADFLAAVEVDPDTLIATSRDTAPNGRAVRDEHLRRLKRWVAGTPGSAVQRIRRENLVRGFFIANGVRVMTKPYPDVYHRVPERPPEEPGA